VTLSYDKVSTMDSQSWLPIHYYAMQTWVRIPILISLDQMIKGLKSDNVTKEIMKVLMIGGDLWKYQIAHKFICFGGGWCLMCLIYFKAPMVML
jgi:hypothetical protein